MNLLLFEYQLRVQMGSTTNNYFLLILFTYFVHGYADSFLKQSFLLYIPGQNGLSIPHLLPEYATTGNTIWTNTAQDVTNIPTQTLETAVKAFMRDDGFVCNDQIGITVYNNGLSSYVTNTSDPIVCALYRNNIISKTITLSEPFDSSNTNTGCHYGSAGFQCAITVEDNVFQVGDDFVAACQNMNAFTGAVLQFDVCNSAESDSDIARTFSYF